MTKKQLLAEVLRLQNHLDALTQTPAIRESAGGVERLLPSILMHIAGGILIETSEQKILHVNQNFCDMFGIGIDPQTLAGQDSSVVHRQLAALFPNRSSFLSRISQIRSRGKAILNEELELKNKQVMERDCIPVRVAEGRTKCLWHYRDITNRKQADKALHENRERLKMAMAVANDGMWDWDLDTNVVYFDPIYYTMAGYAPDEFPHKLESFQQRIHPDDTRKVMDTADKHLKGEIDRFVVEFRFKIKDGGWMWIMGRGKIVERDNTGRPTRFIGTHTDITERKQAEEALRESEEKYRHLIHHSGEAIYLLYNRRFELINHKFQEMFGVRLEDVNQQDFDFIQLVAPKSRPVIEERIRRQRSGESLEPTYEFTALDAGGCEIEVEATVTYVRYKEGFATQGILRDITGHKRLESQLRQVQKMEAVENRGSGLTLLLYMIFIFDRRTDHDIASTVTD